LAAICIAAAFAIGFGVLNLGLGALASLFFNVAFFGGVLAGAVWLGTMAPPGEMDEDLALARQIRDGLIAEERDWPVATRCLADGEPFVLYLRTFVVEIGARSEADLERERKRLDEMFNETTIDPTMPNPALRRADLTTKRLVIERLNALRAEWNAHRAVLKAIASLSRVICFANIRLSADKRAEMSDIGVLTFTILRRDWWPVFLRFCERASVVVVFLEMSTASILNELSHLAEVRKPVIVVSTAEMAARLSDARVREAIRRNPMARQVMVSEQDASLLSAQLVETLRETA
jgi:hypothetical protein